MSDIRAGNPSQEDIEQLLPWFVTGKLEDADKQLVESYLRTHPALRSQIALIEAEQSDVTANNEAVGAPSADLLAKLMVRIEGRSLAASPLTLAAGWMQRALDWLGDRSALVPVVAAATFAVLLQAGVIATLLWHSAPVANGPKSFQTASAPPVAATDAATYVLAGFAPTATAQQIEQTLTPLGITIADGPKAGGIYRLRLAGKALGEAERDMLMTALKANSGVVRFVAPAGP